jgi:beta-glucosidase/6-phospho-beta-glucosidase/beta-galactosidase
LIGVDRKSLERTIKPSGRIYGRIAASNSLSNLD